MAITENPERRRRPPMTVHQGAWIFGNTALGHSSTKFKPRRRPRGAPESQDGGETLASEALLDESSAQDDTVAALSAATEVCVAMDPDVQARACEVIDNLLKCDPAAPSDIPMQGRIVKIDAVTHFVAEHRKLAQMRGLDAALPRIVYHWTQEKHFAGIIENGLQVPDGAGVSISHGSSFGLGIYVSPDFRYGQELFAYGAPVAFMCLALPGKQHFGKPQSMDGYRQLDGWDSVAGREGQRGVDEWVFFDNNQLLTCFLVDRLGVIPAKEALHAAIKILQRPWSGPAALGTNAQPEVDIPLCAELAAESSREPSSVQSRWNRRNKECELTSTVPDAAEAAIDLSSDAEKLASERNDCLPKERGRRWDRTVAAVD